jgi:integrase
MPGRIVKRSRSSWTLVVDLGPDPVTGRRRQHSRAVRGTKREAEAELVRILDDRNSGVEQPSGRVTVAEYLARWLRDYVEPSLAPKTQATYRDVIRVHLVPELGSLKLAALRPSHIQSLYTRLGSRLSPRSIQRYHQVLHAALRQAVRWQLLVRNPADAVEPPRPARRELRATTPAEARRVMEAADATPYGPLVRLAVLTGMRRGELLGLRWQDVDLTGGTIHVQQTAQRIAGHGIVFRQPKTRLSRRSIALSSEAVALLRQHRVRQAEAKLLAGPAYQDQGLVFASGIGTPVEPGNLRRSWLGITAAAGLPGLRVHDLRHAHATLMLGSGVHPKVVSERLGHASVNITLDTYSHVLPGLQAAAAEALDALLAEPKVEAV